MIYKQSKKHFWRIFSTVNDELQTNDEEDIQEKLPNNEMEEETLISEDPETYKISSPQFLFYLDLKMSGNC